MLLHYYCMLDTNTLFVVQHHSGPSVDFSRSYFWGGGSSEPREPPGYLLVSLI